ncbi:hypothetical protein J5N97_012875 [Dioscorea zingiberensis]|uniref:Aquaporin NIP1-1 n=1 Tax=Dioscorea zingiberensis TaxID=325984 RepID=A0A9D5HI45_9LILI|nr:hypothetical protein J5N97_012875 [Dioscorea zingiberensis]
MGGKGENSVGGNGMQERNMEEGAVRSEGAGDVGVTANHGYGSSPEDDRASILALSVPFLQKIIAEVFGTYFLIFAGCGSVTVNLSKGTITFPGICVVWGLAVMVMVYAVGHISGAHFNPAVTIAFATSGRFPWKQVPVYVSAQLVGSTLASGTLRLLFGGKHEHFPGTIPAGSDMQSFVLEFIITFYLMFVISGVATDNRAIGELAGLAVGATVLLNVLFAGPISGASMNPARSLGPAFVSNRYEGIWVYIVAPIIGHRRSMGLQHHPFHQQAFALKSQKSGSFLRSLGRNGSN